MKQTGPAVLPAVLLAALLASDARAQPAAGAFVSGTVGAMVIGASTDLSVSGSAGYRFNRALGLGIEVTYVPSSSDDRRLYGPRVMNVRDASGRVAVFTTNLRLEIPTTTRRVVPYAVAGGGVANVKQRLDAVIILDAAALTWTSASPLGMPAIYPPPDIPYTFLTSTTELALTVGGGASILAGGHVSVDVDLRYLRLLGDQDRNAGRFGAGLSYRF